jgi:putative SOS response-associated peptidase YedK
MCGRFTLAARGEAIRDLFQLVEVPDLPPRYNIAPTQLVPIVRARPDSPGRELVSLRWGLIPGWAPEVGSGPGFLNARSESAAGKPAFRSAFRQRRCLVPADGFYEWQKLGARKQPYYIRLASGQPFAFAGLWETWKRSEQQPLETFTILTTEANPTVQPIHERMPVILDPRDFERWLDPAANMAEEVQPVLKPYESGPMEAWPISTYVNNARNEGARCVERLAAL